jgi:hypothetical protein
MGWTTRGLFRAADFHVGVKRKKNSLSGVQWVGVAGVVRLVDVQREGVAAVWIKKKKKTKPEKTEWREDQSLDVARLHGDFLFGRFSLSILCSPLSKVPRKYSFFAKTPTKFGRSKS